MNPRFKKCKLYMLYNTLVDYKCRINEQEAYLYNLDIDDEGWIHKREADEVVLVEIHQQEFIYGRLLHRFTREHRVKVTHVSVVLLCRRIRYENQTNKCNKRLIVLF